MHGEAKLLLKFLDGSDNRYIIPVYFGIIVTSVANKGGKSDYLVIDGQQRITTISILFTAMVNLMKTVLKEIGLKSIQIFIFTHITQQMLKWEY